MKDVIIADIQTMRHASVRQLFLLYFLFSYKKMFSVTQKTTPNILTVHPGRKEKTVKQCSFKCAIEHAIVSSNSMQKKHRQKSKKINEEIVN